MNGEFDDDDYLPAVPDSGGDLAPYSPAGTDWLPASAPAGRDYVPDANYGQHSAAPALFGQQLPAGVTRQAAQRHLDGLTSYFTQAALQQGVPQHFIMSARTWLQSAARGPAPNGLAAHPYRLYGFNFSQADESLLNSFLNFMYRSARAPEAVVSQFLSLYTDLVDRLQQAQQPQQPQPQYGPTLDTITDREYEHVMRRADADKRAGRDELRTAWGDEFAPRLRVVQQYFNGLPGAERDYIESAVTQGGTLAANSPEFIDRVYRHAIGPLPTGAALQAEIAAAQGRMKTDRKAWLKDERAQLRYREMLRLRDGE